jgi:predicted transposase/invertase (TIGR01784 family)
VELSKLDKVVEKPIGDMNAQEHWAVFFRYSKDKAKRGKINEIIACEEGIAMASEVLMTISKDEVERARLMSEEKYLLDTQSKLVHAKQEGLQQGLQRGLQQGKLEIARNLKAIGMPLGQIAQATGLTEEQINEL